MKEMQSQEMLRLLGFNHLILANTLDTSSLEGYGHHCYTYLQFAKTREAALRPETLAQWIESLASATFYTPSTINQMATAIRRLMREAGNQGYIDQTTAAAFQHIHGIPTIAFSVSRFSPQRQDITASMIQQMAQTSPLNKLIALRDRALLLTLACSGLRVETCRLLNHGAEGDSLAVQRRHDPFPRTYPLSQDAAAALHAWIIARPIPSPYLFTRFEGRSNMQTRISPHPLSRSAVSNIIHRYGTAIGLPHLKPSDLRKYVGQCLAQQDIFKAQQVLGYKNLATVYEACFPAEINWKPDIMENLF